MSISPEAQDFISRLARMDPARPRVDRNRVAAALAQHLDALGLAPRPLAWAPDPTAGHRIVRDLDRDHGHELAWKAARDAARKASASAVRRSRIVTLVLIAIALATAIGAATSVSFGLWIIPLVAYLFVWWSVVHTIRDSWGERSLAAEIAVAVGSLLLPLALVAIAADGTNAELSGLALAGGIASALAAAWARNLATAATAGVALLASIVPAFFEREEIVGRVAWDGAAETEAAWIVTVLGVSLTAFMTALGEMSGSQGIPLVALGTTAAGGACCWALARLGLRLSEEPMVRPVEARHVAIAEAWSVIGDDWRAEDAAWPGWILPAMIGVGTVLQAAAEDDGWSDDRNTARLAAEDAAAGIGDVNCAALTGDAGCVRLATIARPLVEAYEAGLFASWICPDRIVCIPRPVLSFANGVLHDATGPAVQWPSGRGQWFRHAVHIPAWIMTEPERVTLHIIQDEPHEGIRRAMIEAYGPSRFLRETGADLLHHDEYGRLWEITFDDGDVWRIVEVENGTPEPDGSRRTYTLDVSGAEAELGWSIETARAAVAATYGLRAEQYRPEVRT